MDYPAVPGPFRAFAPLTEAWGPLRASYEEACADASERTPDPTAALVRAGERWIVAAEDPGAPGRAVEADEGRALSGHPTVRATARCAGPSDPSPAARRTDLRTVRRGFTTGESDDLRRS